MKNINNVFWFSEVYKNNNTQKIRVDGVKQPVAFFIIHTKLQKSIELQVLEVHDTYLILQDLKYSNDYMVNLVGKESTDFNVGDLVIVTYNGDVADTAPASLGGVTGIKPLKK